MTDADDFPSLMDDTEFLAELEKVEGPPPRASADRASRVALATGFATARKPIAIDPDYSVDFLPRIGDVIRTIKIFGVTAHRHAETV